MLKHNVRTRPKASARAWEKNSPWPSRGVPHLHNLVFGVDELDLWHVDAHGIACLFRLLSGEMEIRRHGASVPHSPFTNAAGLTPVHGPKRLGTGRLPWSQ